uniref:Uncharacterized protein n=1 Tax=Mus musculus TaxID=10090 RepID=Q3UT62_MOUSE|nr:unnamed protein product [Mus musculus]
MRPGVSWSSHLPSWPQTMQLGSHVLGLISISKLQFQRRGGEETLVDGSQRCLKYISLSKLVKRIQINILFLQRITTGKPKQNHTKFPQ